MDVPALVVLAFVASITPGPNNLMLLASGMNFGPRRTLPHLAGVSLGFALLMFVVALGLGALFERYRLVEQVLTVLGASYLAYLAWRLFRTTGVATASPDNDGTARPMTFLEAAAFQWVNPKAWVMTTTATSTLLSDEAGVIGGAVALAVGFGIVNLPCITTWMLSGVYAARWVESESRIRAVNRTLGVLLAGTVVLLII